MIGERYPLPFIGQQAPAFKGNTTKGIIHFPIDYSGRWVVLFSHLSDFTPVCTTEFMVLGSMASEFEKLNCQLLGISVSGLPSHIAWLRTIRDNVRYRHLHDIDIRFPLIDDISTSISKKYGMIYYENDELKSVRTLFIIDPGGTIRSSMQYPSVVGRNFDEVLRTLTALQVSEKFSVALPANWHKGEDVIVPMSRVIDDEVENNNPIHNGIVIKDSCSGIVKNNYTGFDRAKINTHEWFFQTMPITENEIDEKLYKTK